MRGPSAKRKATSHTTTAQRVRRRRQHAIAAVAARANVAMPVVAGASRFVAKKRSNAAATASGAWMAGPGRTIARTSVPKTT
jgi:hypothetical protein